MEDRTYTIELFQVINSIHSKHIRLENLEHITRGEKAVLRNLSFSETGLTPSDLSKCLRVGSGRIGNVLKTLESKGYIQRVTCDSDKRKTIVTLTDKGRSFCFTEEEAFARSINAAVKRMGVEEYDKFLKNFGIFLEEISKTRRENDAENI